MVIYAETSFLFSYYGSDSNTLAAIDWSKRVRRAIQVVDLTSFELLNALRFAEFRRAIKSGEAATFAGQYLVDVEAGRVMERPSGLSDVVREASRLSRAHTLTGGHRGFDILHVAAAKIIGATHFLSFDLNQKRLAEKEGLIVPL